MDKGIEIKRKIMVWAESGGDFDSGISLFLTYNRNIFYAKGIMRKGADRGMKTLLSEFSKKTKLPLRELSGIIARGQEGERVRLLRSARNDRDFFAPPAMTEGEAGAGVLGEVASSSLLAMTISNDAELKKHRGKLREEFPFLGRKDCPDELAILVNKMITAYDDYRRGHEQLYEIDTNDLQLCYQAGKEVLDAYILNREIWEELNYYKINGKIKGDLPELKNKDVGEEYRGMNTMSLMRIMGNNIPRKMTYYKQQLASEKTKNKDEIRDKIERREMELQIIKEILRERGEM